MENLTKENFWNELYTKYSNSMELFCNWINEYKKDNDWKELFNSGYDLELIAGPSENEEERYTKSPKYHELPLAMQVGIFLQFVEETSLKYQTSFLFDGMINIRYRISDYLKRLENQKLDV